MKTENTEDYKYKGYKWNVLFPIGLTLIAFGGVALMIIGYFKIGATISIVATLSFKFIKEIVFRSDKKCRERFSG